MSKTVRIKKGLNINLEGQPEKIYATAPQPKVVALKPTDIAGLTPKLKVKEGQEVLAGDALFFDKDRPEIQFPSPVSGEVAEIIRGAKRKVLEIRVLADAETRYREMEVPNIGTASVDDLKKVLQESGLWSFIIQRPYAVVADPKSEPKAIFISGFDTNPLSADMDFCLFEQEKDLQTGLDVLSKLTSGKVHLSLSAEPGYGEAFKNLKAPNLEVHKVSGPHPAGNVGVQIHHIDPINKGEIVWTITPQEMVFIGRLFNQKKVDLTKIIAVAGSGVKAPKHYKTVVGAPLNGILDGNIKDQGDYRIVSGSPLSGEMVSTEGFLGYYDNQVAVLPEGNDPKFVLTDGWLSPGFNRFSASKAYPTWLIGKNKKYDIDTNLNGEERAFVVSGQYEKVFPFDIYPVHLIKAILANDIELMENLGIYEVAPEDFALCEFVCTSKIEAQQIVRDGIMNLRAEMA
ncbi:Na(+)-translocating NADH-quinone reductase subunit A [Luteibaculum oceani]|uniref:Na(+)-translocating NADH-quinone reductase subunit A n=1 Tax=Luteibaculum oceani TaxID=1294296 RepID=A0A5C6V087_9FLAO|nr:Na(+)-translocating NADH-quinone reductase subunit A [Luteibaculum oceani]TXC78579.1 Na(+)-translocating NADH-quinone reductase subunit A [Luteibaculum oceani]